MDRSEKGPVCPACGATSQASARCGVCSARSHGTELKVLPALAGGLSEAAEIKLVRQLKIATADRLASDPGVDRLPGVMKQAEQALDQDDLVAADQMLDAALAVVLMGPGHQRRASYWGLLPVVLWLWCGVLAVLLAFSFLV